MDSAGRLGEARRVLGEEGVRGLGIRLLGRTVYRRLELYTLDLEDYPGAGRQPEGLEVVELTRSGEDLEDYRRMRPDTPVAELVRRLDAGQHCFCVRRDGAVVSARWIDTASVEVEYLGLRFGLPPGYGHLYDVYTAPEARRSRIGRVTFPVYVAMLAGLGVERLLVTGLAENRAGIGLIEAAGYRRAGRVGAILAGPGRIPLTRKAGIDLGPGRRLGR